MTKRGQGCWHNNLKSGSIKETRRGIPLAVVLNCDLSDSATPFILQVDADVLVEKEEYTSIGHQKETQKTAIPAHTTPSFPVRIPTLNSPSKQKVRSWTDPLSEEPPKRDPKNSQTRQYNTILLPCENTGKCNEKMVIPPAVRPAKISKYLKPYVLRMHFTNKYVSAQVVHTPTATVASSASSQEKQLRLAMENTRDVAAAAKIGKLLGERLLLKGVPAVSIFLKREQKYHGKVKAVIDSVREAGVKLL